MSGREENKYLNIFQKNKRSLKCKPPQGLNLAESIYNYDDPYIYKIHIFSSLKNKR